MYIYFPGVWEQRRGGLHGARVKGGGGQGPWQNQKITNQIMIISWKETMIMDMYKRVDIKQKSLRRRSWKHLVSLYSFYFEDLNKFLFRLQQELWSCHEDSSQREGLQEEAGVHIHWVRSIKAPSANQNVKIKSLFFTKPIIFSGVNKARPVEIVKYLFRYNYY